jgi:hypothetical protein
MPQTLAFPGSTLSRVQALWSALGCASRTPSRLATLRACVWVGENYAERRRRFADVTSVARWEAVRDRQPRHTRSTREDTDAAFGHVWFAAKWPNRSGSRDQETVSAHEIPERRLASDEITTDRYDQLRE